jgi:hypothetical protein
MTETPKPGTIVGNVDMSTLPPLPEGEWKITLMKWCRAGDMNVSCLNSDKGEWHAVTKDEKHFAYIVAHPVLKPLPCRTCGKIPVDSGYCLICPTNSCWTGPVRDTPRERILAWNKVMEVKK